MGNNMVATMVDIYKNGDPTEMAIETIALKNIESEDRAFANECEAGDTLYSLNVFINTIKTLAAYNEQEKLVKYINNNLSGAEKKFDYIKGRLHKMNNNSRYYEEIERVKKKLEEAK